VDPVAKTATVWLNNLPEPQQMALDEDGSVLSVAMDLDAGDGIGIDTASKATVFDYAQLNPGTVLSKPAGLAVGSGSLACELRRSQGTLTDRHTISR
jgi:hypothetical protein